MLDVEHALPLLFNPLLLGKRLTFGTMPVAARVVHGPLVFAARAPLDVPAQCRGAALGDIRQDPSLGRRQGVPPLELSTVSPDDVRNVEAPAP
jgi:hypothetical protein